MLLLISHYSRKCLNSQRNWLLRQADLQCKHFHTTTTSRVSFYRRLFSPVRVIGYFSVGSVIYVGYSLKEWRMFDFFDFSTLSKYKETIFDTFRQQGRSLQEILNAEWTRWRPNDWQQAHLEASENVTSSSISSLAVISTDMLDFTRRMLEIRDLLRRANFADVLDIPSIVVVGSQSSGKSSVLESIIGQEFLPKGKDLVTRRPLEITLQYDAQCDTPYALFPLSQEKWYDFRKIQHKLTEMNLSVAETDCVSEDPIILTIVSANVPNLQLIDLPGYIRVHNVHQPPELHDKIERLCSKYMHSPNILLAISAADVDLANSEAIRATRRLDPKGERTLGVITKLDLVDPDYATNLLSNRLYPLQLGYIGVVNKSTDQDRSLLSPLLSILHKNESAPVGLDTLKKRLSELLESKMRDSLFLISERVHRALQDCLYRMRASGLTVESESFYVIDLMEGVKQQFRTAMSDQQRPFLASFVKDFLNTTLLDTKFKEHENNSTKGQHSDRTHNNDANHFHVGKELAHALQQHLMNITENQVLSHAILSNHPSLKIILRGVAEKILSQQASVAADAVENSLRPWKLENMDLTHDMAHSKDGHSRSAGKSSYDDTIWSHAYKESLTMLENECTKYNRERQEMLHRIGKRKLLNAVYFVESGKDAFPEYMTHDLYEEAQKYMVLGKKLKVLESTKTRVKQSCKKPLLEGNQEQGAMAMCPEVITMMMSEKMAEIASYFLYLDMMKAFSAQFARELASMYGRMTPQEMASIAKENPRVDEHLALLRSRDHLMRAYEKLKELKHNTSASPS